MRCDLQRKKRNPQRVACWRAGSPKNNRHVSSPDHCFNTNTTATNLPDADTTHNQQLALEDEHTESHRQGFHTATFRRSCCPSRHRTRHGGCRAGARSRKPLEKALNFGDSVHDRCKKHAVLAKVVKAAVVEHRVLVEREEVSV